MGALTRLEGAAMRLLPPSLVKSLQEVKRALPLRLHQAEPVVQMFVNDGMTRSYVGVHNYFSCLLPEVATAAIVELTFYDQDGRVLTRHHEQLAHFGADAVDVASLFAARGVDAPHGVVTMQLTPTSPRRASYRELGRFAAHFFVFFRDTGSVEQTHPLSTTGAENVPSGRFVSSQVVSTVGLEEVVLFQYNPGQAACALEHRLLDLRDGRTVATVARTVPALGSCRSVFRVRDLVGAPAQVLVCVDPLPSANAKPMLRRVFASGLHSMSHA
jgi:hypothetical protein